MKANDLRVGNLIHLIGSRQGIVLEVRTNHARIKYELDGKEKQSHVEYENLIPIPLTEEWFLCFGFVKGKNYYSLNGFDVDDKGWIGFNNMVADCNIKYVHKLQNLYFALTGKELEATP